MEPRREAEPYCAESRAGNERPGLCVVVIFLLSLVYFAPLWLHPTEVLYSEQSDFLNQTLAWHRYAVEQFQGTGRLPLWFALTNGGQPFQAETTTQLFYPPFFVFYLVPVAWIGPLFGWLLWAHVLAAGLLMFAYARSRGLVCFAALVAAVGFMFAGKWLLHLLQAGHHSFLPLAWFPLLLLWAEAAIERRCWRYAVGAGMVAALIFTGCHPQLTLYLVLLAAALSLRPVWSLDSLADAPSRAVHGGEGRRRRLCWWLGTWATAGSVAVGLAAIQLLPNLELVSYTTSAQVASAAYGREYDLIIHNFRQLGQRLLALQGPQNFGGNAWESVGAFGVLWTAVTLLALAMCRRSAVWWYAAVLLLMLVFSLNTSTPVYPLLRRIVPGLALFRIPTRFLLIAGFPLGMLAGCFTQRLFCGAMPRQTLVRAGGCVAALVVLYVAGSLQSGACWHPYETWLCIFGPALALVLVAQALRPERRRWMAAGWLTLLAGDLWAMHGRLVQTRPLDEVFPVNDAVRFLARHPGSYRVLDRYLPGQSPRFTPFSQGLCCRHGIEWVRGYSPSNLVSYRQYLQFIAGLDGLPDLSKDAAVPTIRNQQLLDLLGVRYLFCPADIPLAAEERAAWRAVATLTDNRVFTEVDGLHALPPFVVYQRTEPLPLAFLVSRAQPAPDAKDRLRTLADTDLTRTVFLDNPPTLLESAQEEPAFAASPGPAFQEARQVLREPNRVVVEVERREAGYLVLLDPWYPGWQCHTAEGQKLPVYRANSYFRAVAVPPGRHRLEFIFAPRVYALGRGISLATLALLGSLGAWSIRRARWSQIATGTIVDRSKMATVADAA
jgi:hypothetical protein